MLPSPGVAGERLYAAGGVPETRGKQRLYPAAGVEIARGIAKERHDSEGGVVATRRVAKQCLNSRGGVAETCSVAFSENLTRSNNPPHRTQYIRRLCCAGIAQHLLGVSPGAGA